MDMNMDHQNYTNTNPHYKIFDANFFKEISILYLDHSWDMQEASLAHIMNTPELLSRFAPSEINLLRIMYGDK